MKLGIQTKGLLKSNKVSIPVVEKKKDDKPKKDDNPKKREREDDQKEEGPKTKAVAVRSVQPVDVKKPQPEPSTSDKLLLCRLVNLVNTEKQKKDSGVYSENKHLFQSATEVCDSFGSFFDVLLNPEKFTKDEGEFSLETYDRKKHYDEVLKQMALILDKLPFETMIDARRTLEERSKAKTKTE